MPLWPFSLPVVGLSTPPDEDAQDPHVFAVAERAFRGMLAALPAAASESSPSAPQDQRATSICASCSKAAPDASTSGAAKHATKVAQSSLSACPSCTHTAVADSRIGVLPHAQSIIVSGESGAGKVRPSPL
jgi:hypothetical protein